VEAGAPAGVTRAPTAALPWLPASAASADAQETPPYSEFAWVQISSVALQRRASPRCGVALVRRKSDIGRLFSNQVAVPASHLLAWHMNAWWTVWPHTPTRSRSTGNELAGLRLLCLPCTMLWMVAGTPAGSVTRRCGAVQGPTNCTMPCRCDRKLHGSLHTVQRCVTLHQRLDSSQRSPAHTHTTVACCPAVGCLHRTETWHAPIRIAVLEGSSRSLPPGAPGASRGGCMACRA
jgi:hypothetical protein